MIPFIPHRQYVEKEGTFGQESQGYSFPPTTTTHSAACLSQERITAHARCSCCERCNGPRPSKRSATMLNGEPRQLRDTLWIYLIRSQVEETATESKRASLMRRLTTIADAFDALIQYTQSLRVSCLAANRVFDTSQALLALRPASGCANRATDEDFLPCRAQIQIETEKRMASLRELMERCTRNVVLPEGARTLLDHHADKRKDFLVASANLESLLENPRLSVSQMEKLRRQHNAILEDLRRSARLVNAELPRIVDLRLQSLQRAFHEFAELCEDTDDSVRAASLFRSTAINLCHVTPDVGETALREQEACEESCGKCQTNCTYKK